MDLDIDTCIAGKLIPPIVYSSNLINCPSPKGDLAGSFRIRGPDVNEDNILDALSTSYNHIGDEI